VFTAALLSLAGIPLTAGFVGKFYVLAADVGQAQWLLVGALALSSVIGLFYYLRIVAAMYQQPIGEERGRPAPTARSLAGSTLLAGLTLALVWLGVYPAPLIDATQEMAARLS
jgi:NADH-quinone oxidoreductase subunit N